MAQRASTKKWSSNQVSPRPSRFQRGQGAGYAAAPTVNTRQGSGGPVIRSLRMTPSEASGGTRAGKGAGAPRNIGGRWPNMNGGARGKTLVTGTRGSVRKLTRATQRGPRDIRKALSGKGGY